MKYYIPELKLAVLSPPQTQPMDKFGGLPWGLPAEKWPRCEVSQRSMALIAQFYHHDERLDLGAPGRCLFVFMCEAPDASCAGCNASFVLEPEELDTGLTWPPDAPASWPVWTTQCCGQLGPGEYGGKVWIEVEARVIRWLEADDQIDPALAEDFDEPGRFWRVPLEVAERVYPRTKLGGVPYWWQEPRVPEGARFCAQFADALVFPPPLPEADDVGCTVTIGGRHIVSRTKPKVLRHDTVNEICDIEASSHGLPVGSWCCDFANFSLGMAYLFLKPRGAAPPDCHFFWQSS